MSGACYTVKDGDTAEEVVQMGCVRMAASVGFCELCRRYRNSHTWQVVRLHGTPYGVCSRHTPMDIALWKEEQQ